MIHRGTCNVSSSTVRHMFYMLYTKPWFNENINFGDVSVFSAEAAQMLASSRDVGSIVAKNEDRGSSGYCNIDSM